MDLDFLLIFPLYWNPEVVLKDSQSWEKNPHDLQFYTDFF